MNVLWEVKLCRTSPGILTLSGPGMRAGENGENDTLERSTSMTEPEQEGILWDRISRGNKILCDNCGHSNDLESELCEQCQTPLPIEDEDGEPLTMVVGEEAPASGGAKKVLLKDSVHLNNLRRACEGVESETMSADEYMQIVKKIHTLTKMGVDLFNSDVVKKKMEELSEEDLPLVKDTQVEIEKYHLGVSRMIEYLATGDKEAAREGFNKAEEALTKLDRIQDRAIEMMSYE